MKREEFEEFAPWYATGKLSEAEREQVDAYLRAHPEAQGHLELAQQELEATVNVNEQLAGPSAGSLERLMARLDTEDDRSGQVDPSPMLTGWLSRLFGVQFSPALRFAGTVAAVLIAVQAVVIGSLTLQRGDGPQYETASGPQTVAEEGGHRFLITFTASAKLADIVELLGQADAVIVAGPKAGGIFEIRVPTDLEESQVNELFQKLRSQDSLVKSISHKQ